MIVVEVSGTFQNVLEAPKTFYYYDSNFNVIFIS